MTTPHRLGGIAIATGVALLLGLRPGEPTTPLGLTVTLGAQVRDNGAGASQVGTAVVSGIVMSDDDTHRPIRRATVSISGGDLRTARSMTTDDAGHFQISGLPAGAYRATVAKPGYVSTFYGSRHPGRGPGLPFALAEGQHKDLPIPLTRGAVVTGIVTDMFGRPLPDVRMTILELRLVNGERRLENVNANGATGSTDERGIYRLWGLPAGTFIVSATLSAFPQNQQVRQITTGDLDWAKQQLASGRAAATPAPESGHAVGYAPVYYPGLAEWASAAQIVVGAGEERGGIDFPVPLVPTATIAGSVVGPDGQPVTSGMQVMLTEARPPNASGGAMGFTSRGMGVDRAGRFSLAGVAPGQYTLTARGSSRALGPPPPPPPAPAGQIVQPFTLSTPMQGNTPDLWASLDLSVSGEDLTGLVLALRPGMTVSGQVTFRGTSVPPADLSRIRVGLNPVTNDGLAFNVTPKTASATGAFAVTGVTPGRYRPTANLLAPPTPGAPPGSVQFIGTSDQTPWRLVSALWQGRDLLDLPLEVHPTEEIAGVTLVFSDQSTELSGSLLTGAGAPALAYVLVVFPTDPSLWLANSRRIRQAQPTADGTFKITNLPPGTYYMGAVTDIETGDLADPTFLEQLAAASLKVTLTEGGKTVQSLKLRDGG